MLFDSQLQEFRIKTKLKQVIQKKKWGGMLYNFS